MYHDNNNKFITLRKCQVINASIPDIRDCGACSELKAKNPAMTNTEIASFLAMTLRGIAMTLRAVSQ
jgi:hypothetical protein